jgi:hypothetical protein
VCLVAGLDELRTDAHAMIRAPHATLDDVVYIPLAADPRDILV